MHTILYTVIFLEGPAFEY